MLDARTKQTIDNACDVLVGRVPNPQTQVDIITTALIYKFMDDMDLDGLELSGHRTFFVGDLEPYAFSAIVNTKGNQDRMNLYLAGLDKVQVAKSVPELFRRIFKEAMIPFRDPTTFALFLKEINELSYDDSETIGDAFEYLLNKMATAKNAGQFRTPRNIIDFIVDVVNPTKNDTILDPACGTAGFLISAYKHITSDGKLTPAEYKQLTGGIVGMDIDPTMAKLALVNLYLHQFEQPKVHEYDTLSDDTRWGEKFDVILANPPFMTPKGGITPHNRFAIRANRSEVLFVDYFMEHLTINGRAGFVVPEGIIFQTANAYKDLRKMMLDGFLYAVVSLPAGVFNPYSPVKTSILFFDRTFAKESKNVLFVRVDNDGFDLGAKRTPIKQNDLPEALKIINEYRDGKDVSGCERAMVVSKERIAENNYDLTAAKYIEKEIIQCKYEKVRLGDLLDYEQPTKYIVESTQYNDSYDTPVLTANQAFILGYTDEKTGIFTDVPVIIFDDFTTDTKFVDFPFKVKSSAMKILKNRDPKRADIRYLYQIIKTIKFNAETHKRYWISEYSNIEIPLPPLDVQQQIVDEIENKQSAINHAREIIKNLERERQYFACLLDGIDYNEVNFDKFVSTLTPVNKIQKTDFLQAGEYPIIDQSQDFIAGYTNNADLVNKLSAPVVVFGDHTCAIKYIDFDFAQGADGIKILTTDAKHLLPKYLYFYLIGNPIDSSEYKRHFSMLKDMSILVPSIDDQRRIVAKLEAEQEIIDANKRLIDLMQDKINQVMNRIYKCDA
ncbi:MAG: methyltransferase domain-containing protein [Alphaproteobacteria bacterium]|nr:methyltransferase domain-containing protein [Alphaproteobacteria bacterium]